MDALDEPHLLLLRQLGAMFLDESAHEMKQFPFSAVVHAIRDWVFVEVARWQYELVFVRGVGVVFFDENALKHVHARRVLREGFEESFLYKDEIAHGAGLSCCCVVGFVDVPARERAQGISEKNPHPSQTHR